MKNMKKIVPALALLLVSAILLGSSTFAWFSMNNKVTVTGMAVTTQVSSNLMIAKDTLGSTTKLGEDLFTNKDEDTLTGKLEPVSTTTGKAFFYTTDAKANGDANAEVYTVYNAAEVPTDTEKSDFNTSYGTTGAVGYIDYVFQLKAVNTKTDAKANIVVSKLNLTYADSVDASKAYRVAFFVEDMGETGNAPAGGSGTLVGVYSEATAANQTANKVVNSTSTVTGELTCNAATKLAEVPAAKTNYYKVVVRLYLEGEDTTCTTATFLDLTKAWNLDLELSLDGTAVNCLTKYTSATVESVAYLYDGSKVYKAADMSEVTTPSAAIKTAFGIPTT